MSDKDQEKFFRQIREEGWEAERGKNHMRLTHESGALVFCSITPSDWRARKKIRSDMRQALRQSKENKR